MSKIQLLRSLAEQNGLIQPKDLDARGIPRSYLQRLCDEGVLQRLERGVYTAVTAEPTEHFSLRQAAKKVPHGVIALLSALQFHQLTTQLPSEVWVAIGPKARPPKISYPPLRIVRFSERALTYGVEEHMLDSVAVRITSKAKTVADCFKFRNKIGLDVALEAMRDYVRARGSMDELWQAAIVCRVNKVMRPYLEAIV